VQSKKSDDLIKVKPKILLHIYANTVITRLALPVKILAGTEL